MAFVRLSQMDIVDVQNFCYVKLLNYSHKTLQKCSWPPANSSAPSCVIAKNSTLMLSVCTITWSLSRQDFPARALRLRSGSHIVTMAPG